MKADSLNALEKLAPLFDGQVILPRDRRYIDAIKVWNRAIRKTPAAVVRCAGKDDIIRAIEVAHRAQLPISVRAGGHGYAGHAVCDGGLVIDLSLMKRVAVDPEKRIVAVEAGVLAGELDDHTEPFGLATPLGSCRDVGVAGYALGGGEGSLTPGFGYGCDNLVRAQIVLADGRMVTASEESNPELFWAIRGAGANFGIVTTMEFKLHPANLVLSGHLQYSLHDAVRVLRLVSSFAPQIPHDLSLMLSLLRRAGEVVLDVGIVWPGDGKAGQRVLEPLLAVVKPVRNTIAVRNYFDEQRAGSSEPGGLASRRRGGHFENLTKEIIDMMLDHALRSPGEGSGITLIYWHGPWCSGPGDNAFGFRRAGYEYWVHAYWQEAIDNRVSVEWVDNFFAATQPFSTGAVYVNDLEEEGESRVRAAYGPNYERLKQIKQQFDPDNFFRSNQNVVPAPEKANR